MIFVEIHSKLFLQKLRDILCGYEIDLAISLAKNNIFFRRYIKRKCAPHFCFIDKCVFSDKMLVDLEIRLYISTHLCNYKRQI